VQPGSAEVALNVGDMADHIPLQCDQSSGNYNAGALYPSVVAAEQHLYPWGCHTFGTESPTMKMGSYPGNSR